MKKFRLLDVLTVLVLLAIIASIIYAFSALYDYKSESNAITPEITTATTTTEAAIHKMTASEWQEQFESNFRKANNQYNDIAQDVSDNLTTIEPVTKPNF